MRWLVPLSELAGVTAHTGGVGRRYAAVLAELAELGVDSTVVLYPDSALDERRIPPAGITLVIDRRWSWLPSFVRPVFRALVFRQLARRARPDVVLAPEWLGTAALVPPSIPVVSNLVTGIELMTEIENGAGVPRSWRRRVQAKVQGWLERRQMRRSVRVIGCSTAIVDWYREKVVLPQDAQVVRNCIDVESVRRASRRAELPEGWPHGERVVLHAGRVEVRKGAHTSVAAFNLLGPQIPDLYLVLAGATGYSLPEWGPEGIASLIDPDLRHRVIFLGDVRSDALYRAMSEAAVCTAPSLWEAFGNIALEVKASRTPLIVTGGSGFDDFCADGIDARVVPAGDAAALAASICDILRDPEGSRRIVEAASEQVNSFTASRVAVDLKTAVEQDLGISGSRRSRVAR